METLTSPVTALRGVGPQKARALEKLGIRTLGDLLRFYPRTYVDRQKRSGSSSPGRAYASPQ